jgi:hypothetical protein
VTTLEMIMGHEAAEVRDFESWQIGMAEFLGGAGRPIP